MGGWVTGIEGGSVGSGGGGVPIWQEPQMSLYPMYRVIRD